MSPGVTCDLVAIANHALDELSPGQCRVVDGAFAEISAGDEEGGFCFVFLLNDV